MQDHKDKFRYEGNRAILFRVDDKVPVRELSHCISMALTYHSRAFAKNWWSS
jgi:hypothetical protein